MLAVTAQIPSGVIHTMTHQRLPLDRLFSAVTKGSFSVGEEDAVEIVERGMDLAAGDIIVGAEVIGEEGLILSISDNGYGKRTKLSDYRLTNRGAKGVINMKTTNKTGKVVGILSVKEDSELMIVTKDGKMIRIDSSEIRQAGRSTQGVRLVRMEQGDQVAAACLIPEAEEGQTELTLQ